MSAREQKADLRSKSYAGFIELFNGLYNVSGGTEGAEKALAFLKAGDADLKIQACVVVSSKPSALLFEGQSKSMLAKGKKKVKSVDISLSKWLPKFSEEELAVMDEAKKAIMERKRIGWPEAFKKVNITQCRRIAFAAFTFCSKDLKMPVLEQWWSKYKDLDQASNFMIGQTKTIFEDQVIKFRSTQHQLESTGLSAFMASKFPP